MSVKVKMLESIQVQMTRLEDILGNFDREEYLTRVSRAAQ